MDVTDGDPAEFGVITSVEFEAPFSEAFTLVQTSDTSWTLQLIDEVNFLLKLMFSSEY